MWGYILGIILGSIVLLLLMLVLIVYLIKSWSHQRNIRMIGLKAEVKINRDIKTWAWQTSNLFLPRTLFKYKKDQLFEVDSLLITPQALFVIEIKSVKGDVDGDSETSYWLKRVNGQEVKMANPVVENEKHIDHIIRMLNIQVPTVSLIIFSNRTDSIKVQNTPQHVLVLKHNRLFETLDNLEKKLAVSLSHYEMRSLYGRLKSFRTNKWSGFKCLWAKTLGPQKNN